jgi:hypothetical protein
MNVWGNFFIGSFLISYLFADWMENIDAKGWAVASLLNIKCMLSLALFASSFEEGVTTP